ncbi:MAG TPA: hypothetical protein VLL76_01280, partial [Candidatus Omnitrophota bacterium]|nr:hypothetical protein [Candidatus Omnitrophota bacterium]
MFDVNQQAFALAHVIDEAHMVSGRSRDAAKLCRQYMEAYLADKRVQTLIGDWKIVWGPQVFHEWFDSRTDNAMAVMANGQTTVVAIASTNPKSLYDWLVEDGDVAFTKDW